MTTALLFAPHSDLAARILTVWSPDIDDGSHDMSHVVRVWSNVQQIAEIEGGDMAVLTAATLLHDCVNVPKGSSRRASASHLSAERATHILHGFGWASGRTEAVAHAIRAHSFSANLEPDTTEARILQDADRLDAIGYIGIARCFYVSGQLNRPLYDPTDPTASRRPLDDTAFALDHFYTKLLRLKGTFQTKTGRRLAAKRHAAMMGFVDGFLAEIAGS